MKMHSSHWGAFYAQARGAVVESLQPFPADSAPSALLQNFLGPERNRARVLHPAVRKAWLRGHEQGRFGGAERGRDDFVRVSWEQATALVARELQRVYTGFGAQAVYGGSYGWGSAGRFHHAQSQIHRFLNLLGGYTASVNTYSQGASSVVLPHVLGVTVSDMLQRATSWDVIAAHTQLFVAFGGMPLKNAEVSAGGTGQHRVAAQMQAAARRGTRFVLVSPQRDDLPAFLDAEWLAIEPGTDTALMLALAHELLRTGREDRAFLATHCVGLEPWRAYLLGTQDGRAKTPAWAAAITGIPAARIARLAQEMADQRTMLNTSWSLQRSWFGEQPVWASIALAALLGQIGLPGGGIGHGYAATQSTGQPFVAAMPTLPQGRNSVRSAIPVARVADMLLHPGADYEYNGQRATFPDIRLVYWCGGNPFHHHQDLHRLREAFRRPDTVIVHEPYWTATARHADIVLPATTTLERNDIGCGSNAAHVFAMQQIAQPPGESRNDHDILHALAARLGQGPAFAQGRDERQWLQFLYEGWRAQLPAHSGHPPPFERFWSDGFCTLQPAPGDQVFLSDFRADPQRNPLRTPSGKIEIFSSTVHGFGYGECPGHPVWREPPAWQDGRPPRGHMPLLANNPATRLHSQLDGGRHSASSKRNGREPLRLHPQDAQRLGIAAGDTVQVSNDKGALLAGAVLSDALRPGVAQLATGAWLDLQVLDGADRLVCVHGNPNVLSEDRGSSRLSQGCVGQICYVQIARFAGEAPLPSPWQAPPLLEGDAP
jgi:biotin/methionine sulfoxide reductase